MAMGISPISAYSNMSPINPVSRMNYQVQNESEVSDAFKDSVNKVGSSGSMGGIGVTSPVRYANATYNPEAVEQKQQASLEANAEFNSIADAFGGATTGYDAARAAMTYASIGGGFDAYA